jgi:amino acid transporter
MSIGAIRGLAEHRNKVGLWISVVLGVLITGGGIFGAFYKVTSPTLLAPWAALIWFAVGVVVMFGLMKGRAPASRTLTDLRSDGEVSR